MSGATESGSSRLRSTGEGGPKAEGAPPPTPAWPTLKGVLAPLIPGGNSRRSKLKRPRGG